MPHYTITIDTDHADEFSLAVQVTEAVAKVFGFDGGYNTTIQLHNEAGDVIESYIIEAGEAT